MIARLRAIIARSVRLPRRRLLGLASAFAAAWLAVGPVHAAPGGPQDRPAPDCLLTYADGQLCGRTSIKEAFKCTSFPGGVQLLATTDDNCVRQFAPTQQCRVAQLPCGDRINLETMAIRKSGLHCPRDQVPVEGRTYSCVVE